MRILTAKYERRKNRDFFQLNLALAGPSIVPPSQEKILNLHSENLQIPPVENGILHEGAHRDKTEPQVRQYLTFPLGVSTRLNLQIYTITNSENSQIYTIRKSKGLNLLIIM